MAVSFPFLRKRFAAQPASATRVPDGQRVYAIGDIHGRRDLLEMMIARVEADDAARTAAQTTVILLGDLVDRGPDSAGVITLARDWAARRTVRLLAGNHEEMFLAAFTDESVLRQFLRFGGRATLLSYPITAEEYHRTTHAELQDLMRARVPDTDIAFLQAMENLIRIGDYVFVHAGIRPGLPLADQAVSDLRWIRGEFIDDSSPRDFAVVHGHTITAAPDLHPWRIGIDTGAFASGVLTAIGLEGCDRWLLQTTGDAAT